MGDIINMAAVNTRNNLISSGSKPLQASLWATTIDSKVALANLCAKRGLSSQALLVWVESPHLRDVAIKLIDYLTLDFPVAGSASTVVGDAIVEAIRAYNVTGMRPGNAPAEVVFLDRLCRCADHVLHSQAIAIEPGTGNLVVWDSWRSSLPEWLRQGRYDEFFMRRRERRTDVERLGARTALAAKLVGHRELGMLEMHRRELGFDRSVE